MVLLQRHHCSLFTEDLVIREAEGLLQVTQVVSGETCSYSSDADDSQSEV